MSATMVWQATEWLPSPAEVETWLGHLEAGLETRSSRPAGVVLSEFLGRPIEASTLHLVGLDHVAFYCGDYRQDHEVESWLDALHRSARVSDVESGPSYIAPRHYGTPGYWVSCRLGGRSTELFTCRHSGPWERFSVRRRQALMSHIALTVDGAQHVEPVLLYLAHYPGIEILASTSGDALGHTYGHLYRSAPEEAVLELVAHSAPGEEQHG